MESLEKKRLRAAEAGQHAAREPPPRSLSHQWTPFFGSWQVDKGEFRWEFLVPWVNRSLTTIDKVVVCSAFVVASFTLQKLFDPGASVGP